MSRSAIPGFVCGLCQADNWRCALVDPRCETCFARLFRGYRFRLWKLEQKQVPS